MRRVLPILALLMAYIMTPGSFDFAEHAVRLVIHGDSAHHDSAEEAEDHGHGGEHDGDEHGCSGTYHSCSCHSSLTFLDSALRPNIPEAVPARWELALRPAGVLDSGFAPSIDRPPQA